MWIYREYSKARIAEIDEALKDKSFSGCYPITSPTNGKTMVGVALRNEEQDLELLMLLS